MTSTLGGLTPVRWALLALLALIAVGCGGPILANPVPTTPAVVRPSPEPARLPDPQPVELPRDDGPHDRLTEWWYDTGHLVAADGRRFGFEMVIFRAERGDFPVAWASHLAITDEVGQRFLYDERYEVGPRVDRSVAGSGFDLAIAGDLSPGIPDLAAIPWTMTGSSGVDRLSAVGVAADGEPFGLDLALDANGLPPALHDIDGYVDFGAAGGSYYYSRTRMAATGSLLLDGVRVPVTGEAWFDHQWGDFIAVGAGGWDWFAVNLDDHTDLTVSLVRDADGGYPLVYGTLVHPDGTTRNLTEDLFDVTVTSHWTSPTTGARYPAGWHITIPDESLVIDLTPTVAAQELDTRATTGVIYWEGSQIVTATRGGLPLPGEAYVELTGYQPPVHR
jgi:predicted secreted hydrolase